jgi:hypothetical protein
MRGTDCGRVGIVAFFTGKLWRRDDKKIRAKFGDIWCRKKAAAAPAAAGRCTANEGERVYLRDREKWMAIFLRP